MSVFVNKLTYKQITQLLITCSYTLQLQTIGATSEKGINYSSINYQQCITCLN